MVLAAPPPSSSSCLTADAAPAFVAASSGLSVAGSASAAGAAASTGPRWVPVEKDFRTSNGALWAFVTTSYQTVTLKTQGTVRMPVYSSLGAGQYGRVFEVRRADGGADGRSSREHSGCTSRDSSSHHSGTSCNSSRNNRNAGSSVQRNAAGSSSSRHNDRNSSSSSGGGGRRSNSRCHQRRSSGYNSGSVDTKKELQGRRKGLVDAAVRSGRSSSFYSMNGAEAAEAEEAVSSSSASRNPAASATQGTRAGKAAAAERRPGAAEEGATTVGAGKGGAVQRRVVVEQPAETAAQARVVTRAAKLECDRPAASAREEGGGQQTAGSGRRTCGGDGAAVEGAGDAGDERSILAGRAAAAAVRRKSGRPSSAAVAAVEPTERNTCSRDAAGRPPADTAAEGGEAACSRKEAAAEAGRAAARVSNTGSSRPGGSKGRAVAGAAAAAATGAAAATATGAAAAAAARDVERKKRNEEEREWGGAAATTAGMRGRGRGGRGRETAAAAAEAEAPPDAAVAVSPRQGRAEQLQQEEKEDEEAAGDTAALACCGDAKQQRSDEAQQQHPEVTEIQQPSSCSCRPAVGQRGRGRVCDAHWGERIAERGTEKEGGPEGEAGPPAAAAREQQLAYPLLPRSGEEEEAAATAAGDPGKNSAGEEVTLQAPRASAAEADGGSSCCDTEGAAAFATKRTAAPARAAVSTKRVSGRTAAGYSRCGSRSPGRSFAASGGSNNRSSAFACAAAAAAHSSDAATRRSSCGRLPLVASASAAAEESKGKSSSVSSSSASACSSSAAPPPSSASRSRSGSRSGRRSSSNGRGACKPRAAPPAAAASPEADAEEETRYAAKLFLLADYETDGITADVLRELSFYNAFSTPSSFASSSCSSSSCFSACASCGCSASSASSAFLSCSCAASGPLCPARPAATSSYLPASSSSAAFPSASSPSASAAAACRCCCAPPPFPNFPACYGCLACLEVSAEFSEGYLNGVRYCSVIVVEKCRADLATFVKGLWAQERMNISALKFYVWQLLNGVAKLHNQNIAHRDLKPENLLVAAPNTSNGQQLYDGGVAVVKIADLGMGRKVRWELSQQAAGSSSQVFTSKQQPAGPLLDRGCGGGGTGAVAAAAAAAPAPSASCSVSAAAGGAAAAAFFAKASSSSVPHSAQALRPPLSAEKLIEAADRMRQSGHVITLPYRPPELLVTDPSRQNSARCPVAEYGLSCDLWSLGVIILEMCLPQHLPPPPYRWQYAFVLHDARKASYQMEVMILENIFKVTGRPSAEELALITREAGAQQAEGLHAFLSAFPQLDTNSRKLSINDFILSRGGLQLDELGLDLLARLLHISPTRRLSAQCALAHPWFHDLPYQAMNTLGLVSHLAELASPQLRRALPTAVRHCVMWWESTGRSVLHTQFAMHGLLHHMLLEEQRMRLRAAQQDPDASLRAHSCAVHQQQQRIPRQRRQEQVTGQQQHAERELKQDSHQLSVEKDHEQQQQQQQAQRQQQQLQLQKGLPKLGREEKDQQQYRRQATVLKREDEHEHQQLRASACTTAQKRQGGTVSGNRQQQHSYASGIESQQHREPEVENPVFCPALQQHQPAICVNGFTRGTNQERHDLGTQWLRQQLPRGFLGAGDANLAQHQQCVTSTIVACEQQPRQHPHTKQQQQQSTCEGAPARESIPQQQRGHACSLLLQKQLSWIGGDVQSVSAQCRHSAGATWSIVSHPFQQSDQRAVAGDVQCSERQKQGRGAASGEAGSERVTGEDSGKSETATSNGHPATLAGARVLAASSGKHEGVTSAAPKRWISPDSAAGPAAADPGEGRAISDSAGDVDDSGSPLQKRHKGEAASPSALRLSRAAKIPSDCSPSADPPSQTARQRLSSSQDRGCREGRRGLFLSSTSVGPAPALPLPKSDAVHAIHAVHVLQQQQHRIVHPTGVESDDELVRSGPRNARSPLCQTQAARCGSTSSLELPLLTSPKPRTKTLLLSGTQKSASPFTRCSCTSPAHSTEGRSTTSTCRISAPPKDDCDPAGCSNPAGAKEGHSPSVDSNPTKYPHCTNQTVAGCCTAPTTCQCPTTTSSGQADHDSATSCHSTFPPRDSMCSSAPPSSGECAATARECGCLRSSNVERGCYAAPWASRDRAASSK